GLPGEACDSGEEASSSQSQPAPRYLKPTQKRWRPRNYTDRGLYVRPRSGEVKRLLSCSRSRGNFMDSTSHDRSTVLSRYFSEIRSYSLLTRDEEVSLAKR